MPLGYIERRRSTKLKVSHKRDSNLPRQTSNMSHNCRPDNPRRIITGFLQIFAPRSPTTGGKNYKINKLPLCVMWQSPSARWWAVDFWCVWHTLGRIDCTINNEFMLTASHQLSSNGGWDRTQNTNTHTHKHASFLRQLIKYVFIATKSHAHTNTFSLPLSFPYTHTCIHTSHE